MSALRDIEIRRLLKFLHGQIQDEQTLAAVEDELRGDYGAEFLREPEFLSYFSTETILIVKVERVWKLKIISYTQMRMMQRGIKQREIINLFERFLEFCESENQIISVGAYTIFGKSNTRSSPLTLRIDVDKVEKDENRAHTVTIFIGRGDTSETIEVNLFS